MIKCSAKQLEMIVKKIDRNQEGSYAIGRKFWADVAYMKSSYGVIGLDINVREKESYKMVVSFAWDQELSELYLGDGCRHESADLDAIRNAFKSAEIAL